MTFEHRSIFLHLDKIKIKIVIYSRREKKRYKEEEKNEKWKRVDLIINFVFHIFLPAHN